MKSDYEFVWNGELIRFAMIVLLGTGTTLVSQYFTNSGSLEDGWWISPITGALLAIIDYVRGRLPASTATSDKADDQLDASIALANTEEN